MEFARRIPHFIDHLREDQFIEEVTITRGVRGLGWGEQDPRKFHQLSGSLPQSFFGRLQTEFQLGRLG